MGAFHGPTPRRFFKTVFSDPKSASIELAHILGPNLAGLVRLDQLTLESASFVDPSLRHRQSDLLFKTTLTNQKTPAGIHTC